MRKCNSKYAHICRLLLAVAFFAIGQPLRAQTTSTWSGLGNNNLWSTATNWQGNVAPASSNNTSVIFTGTTQNTLVHNAGSFNLNSLTFASEAGPFTINQSSTDFFTFQPTTGAGALPHIDLFSSNPQIINFPNTGFQLTGDLLIGGAGGGSLTMNGQIIQLSGSPRLILNAPSILTLTTAVANNFGGLTLNNGILRPSSDVVFGNGAITFGGGTLQLINNLNLTRPIVVNTGGGTIDSNGFTASMPSTALTVTGPGRLNLTNSSGTGAINIAGQLQQTGGLTVSGANNTVTLSGVNTYSGGTTISNGAVLVVDGDGRLGNAANVTTLDGGTLRLTNAAGYNSARATVLGPSGGTIDSAGSVVGLTGVVSGQGNLTKTGPGTLRLLAANTYTGTTQINAGVLQIGHDQGAQHSTIQLNGGNLGFLSPASAPVLGGLSGNGNLTLNFINALNIGNNNASTTYSGNLSGALPNGLTKVGTGTLTLSGNNTFSAPFNIQAGAVIANSPTALSPSAPISLSPGATLDLNGNNFAPISGTSTLNGNVLLRFGALSPSAGTAIAYNGANLSNGFLSGAGQHVFNGNNSFNNVTTFNGTQLIQSGTLNLNNSTIGGSLSTGGTVNWTNGTIASSGNLTLSNAANFTAVTSNGRLTVSGGVNPGTLNITGTPLVLGGGSTTFVGAVSGPGGTIDLNGQSIDLRGGLLVNNGTITNGTTIVGFGALAKGAGIYGAVNVTDGGKFSPGNSPGTVTTASTTWNSGGSYIVEIGQGSHDFWQINGQLNLNASAGHPFTIALASLDDLIFDSTRDQTWPILHADGGIDNLAPGALALDSSNFKNDLGGGQFFLSSTASDLFVNFSPVPEPAALTLSLAAAVLAIRQRRRR